MASRGRLQFTETEQKFETGGRVDKEKIAHRRQEKKSRGIIEETEQGAGEAGNQGTEYGRAASGTGSPGAGIGADRSGTGQMGSETEERAVYEARGRYRGEIPDAADRERSSRGRTGGSAVERARNKAVRENTGSSGIAGAETRRTGSLRFEENREKPPSKLIHRTKAVAEDAAENVYQRAKNLNRRDRETETSEKTTDMMERGADTAVQTGRRLHFQQEARKEPRAFSEPGKSRLTETERRRFSDSPTKRGSEGRRARSGIRGKKGLPGSAREEMRLMYEVDRLKNPWAYDKKSTAIQQKRALRKRYAAKVRARKRKEKAAAAVIETARAA